LKGYRFSIKHRENQVHGKGHHRGMIANENIRIGSNFYSKMKTTFKYLGSLVTNQNSPGGNKI
jgi:hypothetical protein